MHKDLESLKRYVRKKGVGFFINNPPQEVIDSFNGSLFSEGSLNLSFLYHLAGMAI